MPDYKVYLTKKAQKQLDKIPDKEVASVLERIQNLSSNPRPSGVKKLKGRNGYRIRQGNYRIIYEIFDDMLLIDVIAIGHRKEIYK
ncbi:MAG: type II toxin-antitoxin system RelE/ParE family toxin [Chlorobi bacterium]|nr:type II toxin-antitoxin system RelE/ParE family toxin [Chlorobiota bacterium]